jgi:hypothetical protein
MRIALATFRKLDYSFGCAAVGITAPVPLNSRASHFECKPHDSLRLRVKFLIAKKWCDWHDLFPLAVSFLQATNREHCGALRALIAWAEAIARCAAQNLPERWRGADSRMDVEIGLRHLRIGSPSHGYRGARCRERQENEAVLNGSYPIDRGGEQMTVFSPSWPSCSASLSDSFDDKLRE